jgi:primosomal protein N' (replication factor Y) (superfamily II helicase)
LQQTLFDIEPPAWEVDASHRRLVATIVLPTGFDRPLDYLVPDELGDPRRPASLVEAGRRVRAPLGKGNRFVVGYCVEVAVREVGTRRLKAIADVLDPVRLVSSSMLRLTAWMAGHYLAPWGQVLEAVLPSGVRAQAGTKQVALLSTPSEVAQRLPRLDLPEKQQKVLEILSASPKPLTAAQLASRAGCTAGPITALRRKGLITVKVERLATEDPVATSTTRVAAKQLNQDQQRAFDAISKALDSAATSTLLLHGVTGSGKTEVYIQAIEKVVSFGRQAIVLVPEISLTPQTVARFRERFDAIALLHSHQSDVERHRQWRRIAAGGVQVVVGARSAVFAPTPHLGLIVIDEEHESTFKQDSSPRYHAREVALRRAADEQVPVVLASATPSLESWQAAQAGIYQYLSMPRRVNDLPMPAVRTVDLRDEGRRGGRRGAISRPLAQAMDAALRDEGQVILLLNRRGFSTHVQCPQCGYKLVCPQCAVALTFHKAESIALCHWCDHREPPPGVCPDCRSAYIAYQGLGTQSSKPRCERVSVATRACGWTPTPCVAPGATNGRWKRFARAMSASCWAPR